jgi:acetyltransferase-like isoleucine patch superfamily enzyme
VNGVKRAGYAINLACRALVFAASIYANLQPTRLKRKLKQMKTNLYDYLLSFIVLPLILGLALLLVYLLNSWSMGALADYHVVFDVLAFLLFFGLLCALAARIVMKLAALKPGRYSMDSKTFTFWKLFTVLTEFGKGALLPFTTVFSRPPVAQLFGARIGKDIALGGMLVDGEFIRIGEEAIIGQDSVITAHTITSGYLIIDPVEIGARATVGVNCVVMSGVKIGEGAVVTAGAVVPPNTIIPAGEMWGGIPVRKIKNL